MEAKALADKEFMEALMAQKAVAEAKKRGEDEAEIKRLEEIAAKEKAELEEASLKAE